MVPAWNGPLKKPKKPLKFLWFLRFLRGFFLSEDFGLAVKVAFFGVFLPHYVIIAGEKVQL